MIFLAEKLTSFIKMYRDKLNIRSIFIDDFKIDNRNLGISLDILKLK
jgi:hypothetical protein